MTDGNEAKLSQRSASLTEAPLATTLWRLLTPTSIYYLLSYVFFAVDTYFVSKLGSSPLAAMGLAATIVTLTLALPVGLGGAVSAITSAVLGAGDQARARQIVTHALLLAIAIGTGVSALGVVLAALPGENIGLAPELGVPLRDYLEVWLLGFVLVMVTATGHSAIRATGDTRTPALILVVTGAVNVALDPLLILGWRGEPGLGVQGAALATVLSRLIAAIATLWILARRDRLLDLRALAGLRATWSIFLRISGPVALQLLIMAFVAFAVVKMSATLGHAHAAAAGIGFRIEAVALALTAGLAMILPVFMGQNIGAGKPARAAQSVFTAIKTLALAQLLIYVLLAAGASWVAAIFSADATVRAGVETFLWIVPLSYAAQAATATTTAAFVAIGKMRSYMILSVVAGAVLIPSAWIGRDLNGLLGLFVGLSLARMAVGLLSLAWIRRDLRALGYLPQGAPAGAQPAT
jgi:putative MATE family efflux protein